MKHSKSLLPLLALLASLSSCSSGDLYKQNRQSLQAALASYEAGEYQNSVAQSDALAAETASDASKYQLQRFFAAYLAVQSHIQAAFGKGAFLAEPGRNSGMTLGSAGGNGDFSIPHAVVAGRMVGYGYDWAPAAEPPQSARAANLPEPLAALGVEAAKLNMDLCRIAVLTRLGFQAQVNKIVGGASALQDLEEAEALMERTELPAAARPWITWACFSYLKDDQQLRAYKFAVRTLFPGDSDGVGRELERELREWITSGSRYVFRCNSCDADANPTESGCVNPNCPDPRDLVEFRADER